ncbi:MAG TPA: hypothetical protein VN726_11030 [Hanamia sp.]|nr:hypothetical protein [Hanamia sp.]
MKIKLIVVVLFVFAAGCKKNVEPRPLLNGTATFQLERIDNISFTNDNSLLISGVSGDNYTLIKTDINLNVAWTKNGYDWGKLIRASGGWGSAFYSIKIVKVFQRADGSYVCFGSISEGGDVVFSSALVIVLDKNGKQINKYRFDDLAVSNVLKTGDGYILFGNQLVKLDNNFNKLWTKNIFSNANSVVSIANIIEGGFVVTGSYNFDQVYLAKLDANGNQVFTQTYKHNDYPFEEAGFDITQLPDGGFLMVGRAGDGSSYPPIINCQIIRTDAKGDTSWTKRFGYSADSWLDRFVSENQNEFVVQGSIGFATDSLQKRVLLKINSGGEILKSKTLDNLLLLVYSPLTGYVKAEPGAPHGIKLSVIYREDDLFN